MSVMNRIGNAATTTSRAVVLLLWGCAAVIVGACEKAPNVTGPSSPVTPTTGLTISSLPSPLTVGQSVQLTAMVVLPDGTTKLTDAAWKSSEVSVATISSSGVLSVVGRGGADITAAAYQHAASVHVRVPLVITGLVHESVPTETVPVAGARVVIEGGPDAGTSAMTDGAGQFSLEVEAAGFTVAVSKDGYDPASASIAELPRDQRSEITLVPDAVPVMSRLTGGLCVDYAFYFPGAIWTSGSGICLASLPLIGHHFIPVHRAGVAEIHVSWLFRGEYNRDYMGLEVRCGPLMVEQEYWLRESPWDQYSEATRIADDRDRGHVPLSGPLRVSVPSPSICEIKPGRFVTEYRSWSLYQIDVTHPK